MDDATRARRAIPGLAAPGVAADGLTGPISGSTTVLELLRMFPDGRAARLLADLQLPCAHCGGAVREPLTLAAKRHRRSARALVDACRALEGGYPSPEALHAATERVS